MLKVGLTGGIACGKSNALRHFGKLGAFTIDADLISRQVVQPGKPAYNEIAKEFGPSILNQDGTINRKMLGKLVFSDESSRLRLNEIIHPHILAEENRQIDHFINSQPRAHSPVIVVDAALMIEAGSYRKYDVLIVVYCPTSVQLNRLKSREQISEAEAQQRIDSQLSLLEKAKFGDYVIDTTGKLADTFEQVRHIYLEIVQRYEAGEFS